MGSPMIMGVNCKQKTENKSNSESNSKLGSIIKVGCKSKGAHSVNVKESWVCRLANESGNQYHVTELVKG